MSLIDPIVHLRAAGRHRAGPRRLATGVRVLAVSLGKAPAIIVAPSSLDVFMSSYLLGWDLAVPRHRGAPP